MATYLRKRALGQALTTFLGRYDQQRFNEVWKVFKGILGQSNQEDMTRAIRDVFGNEAVMARVNAMIHPEHRIEFLRNHAKSVMRQIRRDHGLNPNLPMVPAVPAVQAPAYVPEPPPVRPIPPNRPHLVIARPINNGPQQQIPPMIRLADQIRTATGQNTTTFDVLRVIIETNGELQLPVSDSLSPADIERLFRVMEERGECPICLDTVPKLFNWTYQCDHRACKVCVARMCTESLSRSVFPIKCPGGCNHYIDPRRIVEGNIVERGIHNIMLDGNILRFVSLQLEGMHIIDPETVANRYGCPLCRTVTVGRPSKDSLMARCTNPFCAVRFCVNCKTPWHSDGQCKQAAEEDEETKKVLEDITKACPRCGIRTGHYRGHACHHLKCRCGHDYCYECLQPWSEHKVGQTRAHCPIFCGPNCRCKPCPECKPGKPCKVCPGCDVCSIKA